MKADSPRTKFADALRALLRRSAKPAQSTSARANSTPAQPSPFQSGKPFFKAFRASPIATSITTLAEGRYLDVNESFLRILGYDYAEVVGHTASELDVWVNLDARTQAIASLRQNRRVHNLETQLRTKSGEIRDVTISMELIELSNELCALTMTQDITERKQTYQILEQRVTERTRELSALLEVSHKVASTLELAPLLSLILDQLKTMVDYTGAAILVPQDDALVFLEYRGPMPREQVMQLRLSVRQVIGYEEVIFRREPVIIPDIWGTSEQALNFQHSGEIVKTIFGYAHSWLGVPLIVKDRLIGILRFDHREPNHFTPQHAQLTMAIANQAAVAIENARLYERAQALAVVEERQRLARELHDSVSQALYGIGLGAQTARELLEAEPTDLKTALAEPLDYIVGLADAGLAEMRALIFDLRPESLETEGLVAGLTKQATFLRARHRIPVSVNLCGEPAVPFEVKEALYRIAQEALHNIVKHARASEVTLNLECGGSAVILEVRDNGVGFDPARDFPGHLGLRSMKERVAKLGGTLEIQTAPGKGTRIAARIPMPFNSAN